MRPAAAGSALYGAALLLGPHQVLRLTGSDPALPGAVVAARVLGARHLAQAAVQASGRAGRWTVLIDGAHAVSMLGLAAIAPRYRRAALASAGAAGMLAISGLTSGGAARTSQDRL